MAVEAQIEMAQFASFARMREAMNPLALAFRAFETFRPANALEMRDALLFVGKTFKDLKQRWLYRLGRLFWCVFLHDHAV